MLTQVRRSVNEYEDMLVKTRAIFFWWGQGGGGGYLAVLYGTCTLIKTYEVYSFAPMHARIHVATCIWQLYGNRELI